MSQKKRIYKLDYSDQHFIEFKESRNEYFHEIRLIKKEFWTKFLENATEKEIFQAYKFTKSNKVEKLSFIIHNEKINVEFENKCDAFIENLFSSPSEIRNEIEDSNDSNEIE